jgi:glucokinase
VTEESGQQLCLGIDFGGTKIAAGLVGPTGKLLWQDRTPTPRARDADALFSVVADLVEIATRAAAARGELVSVGIGCGGPMSGELVSPLNVPAWRSFPLAERVRALPRIAAGGISVAIDNDAKALALAEGWCGRAKTVRNYIAMVVSTGVGGGIVLDGNLLDGAGGNAGHIGHVIVEPGGRVCGCGARGCLEAEASGLAIESICGLPAASAPEELRERAGTLTGRAIASVANLLDLRHAYVGGSVALGYGASFFLAAQRELDACARLAFSDGARVDPVALGPDAPLIGAAAVGWRALGQAVLGDGPSGERLETRYQLARQPVGEGS